MTEREAIIAKRGYPSTIQADELSLKIASYPISARYLADRLSPKGASIAELCCGVGVSVIEFSHYFEKVIGIDNDPIVVESAIKNIESAGVRNCEVRQIDITSPGALNDVRTDIVAYDVPYWSEHDASLTQRNPDMEQIITAVREHVTQDIVIYVPPHIGYEEVAGLFDDFEFQEVWINGRHDRNFVYLGSLAEYFGLTKIKLQN